MLLRKTPTVCAVALAGLLSLVGCSGDSAGPPAPQASQSTARQSGGGVGELTFSGTTLDGKRFDAATLAGKPVVLWFWAPWCPTCRGQAPDVLDVLARYAGKLSVVGVAGLDKQANMQPFVDATKTGQIAHLADPDGRIWQRFKITQQSTYVLIDAKGQVTFTGSIGGDELRAKVAELVG